MTKTILILTVSIFLTGCHGFNVNQNRANFSKASGNLTEDFKLLDRELDFISLGGPFNDTQKSHMESAKGIVVAAGQNAKTMSDSYAKLSKDWDWYHGFWEEWHNAKLGPWTWNKIYWAVGIMAAVGVLYLVSLAEGAGGWLGAVAKVVWWIFHTATAFVFVGLAKLRDWLKAWAAKRGAGIGGMVPHAA